MSTNMPTSVAMSVKRRTSDLNITSSRPSVAKDIYIMYCWLIAQGS